MKTDSCKQMIDLIVKYWEAAISSQRDECATSTSAGTVY
jgi:hypothetical protein